MANLAPTTEARAVALVSSPLVPFSSNPAIGATPEIPFADRLRIEAHIETLIATLDAIDGDPDDEEDDADRCEAGEDGCGVFVHWSRGPLWGVEA